MAFQLGEGAHIGLDDEFVHAGVAAGDDDDVLAGELDHRHGVVDRGLRNLKFAAGETRSLLVRVDGEEDLHLKAMAREKALRGGAHRRQRLRAGEHLHLERRLRRRRAGEHGEQQQGAQHAGFLLR